MPDFTVFASLSEKLLARAQTWAAIADTWTADVIALIGGALTLIIMWQGFNAIRGAGGKEVFLDVFAASIRPFLVVGLGLGAGMYQANVLGLINELREFMTAQFTVGGESNMYVALDNIAISGLQMLATVWDVGVENISVGFSEVNLAGVLQIAIGISVFLAVAFFCIVAAAALVVVDISLAVAFAVGPLFIACLAFQATSSFFNSWLSTVLKYVMTAVILAAVSTLTSDLVDGLTAGVQTNAGGDLLGTGTAAALGNILLVVLVFKSGSIGADLIGSAAMNIAGIAKGMKDAAVAAGKGTKMAGQGATAAGKGAAAAYGAAQDLGRNSSLGQRALQSTAGMRAAHGAGSITGSK